MCVCGSCLASLRSSITHQEMSCCSVTLRATEDKPRPSVRKQNVWPPSSRLKAEKTRINNTISYYPASCFYKCFMVVAKERGALWIIGGKLHFIGFLVSTELLGQMGRWCSVQEELIFISFCSISMETVLQVKAAPTPPPCTSTQPP